MGRSEFYVLESLDGVGKTTIVNLMSERGARILSTPPSMLKKFRPFFEYQDLRLRFLYYLTGVIIAGKQARNLQGQASVICDRYALTTLAAHEAMGLSSRWIKLCQPLINTIAVPDNTFLLTCTPEERKKRLQKRGATRLDEENEKINERLMNGFYDWSTKLGHQLTAIDTTHLLPNEVVNVLEKKMT